MISMNSPYSGKMFIINVSGAIYALLQNIKATGLIFS